MGGIGDGAARKRKLDETRAIGRWAGESLADFRKRKAGDSIGTSLDVAHLAATGEIREDAVNHPPHYNAHPSGVECIAITEHLGFNVGNAIKYLWRAGLKSADPIEDLKKAEWYANREIARLMNERRDASPKREAKRKAAKKTAKRGRVA